MGLAYLPTLGWFESICSITMHVWFKKCHEICLQRLVPGSRDLQNCRIIKKGKCEAQDLFLVTS